MKITSKKERIIQILRGSIEENLSNKEFNKYRKKVNKDEKKLDKQKENHEVEMLRQYQKREDIKVRKTLKQRFKGRDEAHYTKKIVRLEKEYKNGCSGLIRNNFSRFALPD